MVTKDDLREYASMLCGACESSKQKRRAFTIETLTDHTTAPVGKRWIWDACKLRVPSAQHGYVAVFLAVCDTSNKHFVCGMLGEACARVWCVMVILALGCGCSRLAFTTMFVWTFKLVGMSTW